MITLEQILNGRFDNDIEPAFVEGARSAFEKVNNNATLLETEINGITGGTDFLKADGTIPLTSNWDVGSFTITALQFVSDIATGTAPLLVTSTTLVTNLNADLLDGLEATAFATAAQGGLADTAIQTADIDTLAELNAIITDATLGDAGDFATAAQGTTADAALSKAGGQMTGNITMAATETVDGRDLSVDGTKLDGIETGATADQSNAEIKTAYELNANTNEFSDAKQTKLAGIETLADVTDATNVAAAGAAIAGGAFHDGFSDFVADEHLPSSTFALSGHTIASHDTAATGANLTSLTDNSIADTLHRHSELVSSDGSVDPAFSLNAAGQITYNGSQITAGNGGNWNLIRDVNTGVTTFGGDVGQTTGPNFRMFGSGHGSRPNQFLFRKDNVVKFRYNGNDLWDFSTDVDVSGILGRGTYKTADQTITSDAVLSDDADLTVAVLANTNYRVELFILYDSGATPAFQYKINAPIGATLRAHETGMNATNSSIANINDEAIAYNLAGGAQTGRISVFGTLRVAGTAGNIVFQWAQNTSDASNTTLLKGSHMILTKLL